MVGKVMVPLDGSELAERVLPWVLEHAVAADGQIALVRVVPPPERMYAAIGGGPVLADLPDTATLEREAADYLNGLSTRFGGGLKVTKMVRVGDAAREIAAAADAWGADAIAMSTHGWTGVGRLVMGSVADALVRHARKPVLVFGPGWLKG